MQAREYSFVDITSEEFWGQPFVVRDQSFAQLLAGDGLSRHQPLPSMFPIEEPAFWASYGHTKIAGKQILRKGLSPLVTTISTPGSASVIAGMRLRAGKTNSGKGAARMVAQAVATARTAGTPVKYPGAVRDPDTEPASTQLFAGLPDV